MKKKRMTSLKDKESSEYVTFFCKCGCGNGLVFKANKYSDGVELSIVTNIANKYVWTLKEKLKRIWYIITNKEYSYFDMFINGKNLERFKDFVRDL